MKNIVIIRVANISNSLTNNLLVVKDSIGCDFTSKGYYVTLYESRKRLCY